MAVDVIYTYVGIMATNCYIVTDTETGEKLIIDPGKFDSSLVHILEKSNVSEFRYILLTHGHFDHIMGVDEIKKAYGGQIVIHEGDNDCFTDGGKSLLDMFSPDVELKSKADIIVKDGDILPFGKHEIKIISTPGHTEGSVCFIIDNCLFTGDTLFKENIGRTDFPSGNIMKMIGSIRKLKKIKGDCNVYPGHGSISTLEYEKKHNSYMR